MARKKITNSEIVFGKVHAYLLELLKRALKENEGNESELARQIGISPSAVNRLLSGERGQGIKLDTVIKIVTRFGGNMGHLAQLLDETEAKEVFDLSKEHADLIKCVLQVAKRGGEDLEKLKQDALYLAHKKTVPLK